ncbi:MAG TPA: alpha/beta hydrolase [Rhodopseudomonas sp.]|uniref:alpha/beta fold hydrolase n=1 Tax=Rhodopseudomonas sp. TaxID=1078 RepID=UPI002ED7E191
MELTQLSQVSTEILDIAVEHSGPEGGIPALLLHGFPYDPRCYDEVVPRLNAAGVRTLVPYLRGYGGTRFRSPQTLRSGEQAALGHDLLELLDALRIERAVVAGYDWGGRAACVVSALWPERVVGLVSCGGYNIHDVPNAGRPVDPAQEARMWYVYYFHLERGRRALIERRRDLTRQLWTMWSPSWAFDDETLQRSVASFDNPDFVEVVIHSYRHRTGHAAGDPRYAASEARLAAQPAITVPSIILHGAEDGITPLVSSENYATHFTGRCQRRVLAKVGHNPPQEAPREFAKAVLEMCEKAVG